MTRSVSARIAAGLAPLRVRVAPRPLVAPEAESPALSEPARREANSGALDALEVDRLRSMAEHLEAAAALARKVAESLEDRLATSAQTSPYALVTKTNETTHANDLLDAHELAATLKVDVRTARRWSHEQRIPEAMRICGVLRWRRADIDAWLASSGGQR